MSSLRSGGTTGAVIRVAAIHTTSPERARNGQAIMIGLGRGFWRRPYRAERSGWLEEEVWLVQHGPIKTIVAHAASSDGGTWPFISCEMS